MIYADKALYCGGFPKTHSEKFVKVANARKSIIMCRTPGIFAKGLLEDNYACKGLKIKAKSCNWGPMAGFVLTDPMASKKILEADGFTWQRTKVIDALVHGAGLQPLCITGARKRWLEQSQIIEDAISPIAPPALPAIARYSFCKATFRIRTRYQTTDYAKEVTDRTARQYVNEMKENMVFQLKTLDGGDNWSVHYFDELNQRYRPVVALVDPRYERDRTSGRAREYAVPDEKLSCTGDYDLFATWPSTKGDFDERDLVPVGVDWASTYGRVSPLVLDVLTKLNTEVGKVYSGGLAVHHGEEAYRPGLDEGDIDLPFMVFVPEVGRWQIAAGNKYMLVETVKEFRELIINASKMKYKVVLNKSWKKRLSTYGLREYLKDYESDFVVIEHP